MITSNQSRAGRALIGITQDALAKASSVNVRTIMDFEKRNRIPIPATLQAIQNGLASLGVELISENGGGAGVRLAKPGSPD